MIVDVMIIKGPQCPGLEKQKKEEMKKMLHLFFRERVLFIPKYNFVVLPSSYGHTTVKAPYPIRTAKLSTVGPDQYYGRGLRGNLRCCMSFFFFAIFFFFFKNVCACKKISEIAPIQLAKQRLAIIPSRPFG